MKRFTMTALLMTAMVIGLANCSSGSGSSSNTGTNTGATTNESVEVGTGTGDTNADTQTTFNSAFSISQQALTTAFAGGAPASLVKSNAKFVTTIESQEYDCYNSGTFTFSGSYDAPSDTLFNYDFTIGYNDCDGLNGSLDMTGDYSFTDDEYAYESSMNGTVGGNGCVISFDNFGYAFYYNFTTSVYSGNYNGSYSSECDGDVVECTFDNVSIYDYNAYYDSCTLNGEAISSDSSSTEESLEYTSEIESFFTANHGVYNVVATARPGVTGTTFTDGQTYTATVLPDGMITLTTNSDDISMTFEADGHFFESSDTETTMVWKDANDSNITFQVQGSTVSFVYTEAVSETVFDSWDLN